MTAMEIARRRFTVDEYYQMAQAGILGEDDRIELIEGEIMEMVPIGTRHSASVMRLNWIFNRLVGDQAMISIQNPLRLGERSEPQPDLMLLKPRRDFYSAAHPGPEDVLLVVEVIETSTIYDREVKVPLYAKYSIIEVWLLDLQKEKVISCRQPSLGKYGESKQYRRGDTISPLTFPELKIPVADLTG